MQQTIISNYTNNTYISSTKISVSTIFYEKRLMIAEVLHVISQRNSKHMIESFIFHQIMPLGVISDVLKDAIISCNRAQFLPAASRSLAYADSPIILKRRCELPLYALALIIESLKIDEKKSERAEEIHATVVSAGSGFSASLLSSLCDVVEAMEPDSVLFARLIDTCRHNSKIHPVTTLTTHKSDFIFMDGGAYKTINPQLIQKLKIDGKLAVIMPVSCDKSNNSDFRCETNLLHSDNVPLLMPLCDVLIFSKKDDETLDDNPMRVIQLHCPVRS